MKEIPIVLSNDSQHFYEIYLRGTEPVLFDPMSLDTLMKIAEGDTAARAKTKIDLHKVCEGKLIRGPQGEFGLPLQYLVSSLIEAGRDVKRDAKTKFSTLDKTFLFACVKFLAQGEFLPFLSHSDWEPDLRRGVGKSAKVPVPVAVMRPKFKEWEFKVLIRALHPRITIQQLQDLFQWAGSAVGVGGFRPSCRGQFGSFVPYRMVELEYDELPNWAKLQVPAFETVIVEEPQPYTLASEEQFDPQANAELSEMQQAEAVNEGD